MVTWFYRQRRDWRGVVLASHHQICAVITAGLNLQWWGTATSTSPLGIASISFYGGDTAPINPVPDKVVNIYAPGTFRSACSAHKGKRIPKFALLYRSPPKGVTFAAGTAAVGTADIWEAEDEETFFRNPNMRGGRQIDSQMERRNTGFLKTWLIFYCIIRVY